MAPPEGRNIGNSLEIVCVDLWLTIFEVHEAANHFCRLMSYVVGFVRRFCYTALLARRGEQNSKFLMSDLVTAKECGP